MTIPPERFDGRVPPPAFVNIETTKYCNLRCEMCHQFQDGTVATGPHLDLERFERWADATLPFAERFQPSVTGEPLMSKGLPKILAKVREYGVLLDVVTNATLLDARMRSLLLPVLGKITISFDAATKRTFEAVRAGADFGIVVANVRALCNDRAARPRGERPLVVLACVAMRRNIDELPALVDLGHDLGIDCLEVSHVHPPTEDFKRESLVHDVERARRRFDEAFARAEEIGLPMTAQALDRVIAASATPGGGRRKYAGIDGAVEGLGARSVLADRIPSLPGVVRDAETEARRAAARERAAFAAFGRGVGAADPPESIWICDFLWNKTYVTLPGDVRVCCVPGTPVAGNVELQSFAEVWDDPLYAAMRARLTLRDPVACCKGCQHIVELRDPGAIRAALQGRAPPDPADWTDLPVVLDPTRLEGLAPPDRHGEAPVLHWEEARGARGYELELSLDGFKTIAFSSRWHGPLLDQACFALPAWAWAQAPRGVPITWRAVAWLPGGKLEAGLGAVERR